MSFSSGATRLPISCKAIVYCEGLTPMPLNNSTVELSEQEVLKEESQLYQTAAEQEDMGAVMLDANDLIERGEKKSPPDEDAAIELIWRESDAKVKDWIAKDRIKDAKRIKAKFELIKSETEDARVTVSYEYRFFDRQGLLNKDYDFMVWSHHPKELIWECTAPLIAEGSAPDLY